MLNLWFLLPQDKLHYFVTTALPNLHKKHSQDSRVGCLDPLRAEGWLGALAWPYTHRSYRRLWVCEGAAGCLVGLFRPENPPIVTRLSIHCVFGVRRQDWNESQLGVCILSSVTGPASALCLLTFAWRLHFFFCRYSSTLVQSGYAELILSSHRKARRIKMEQVSLVPILWLFFG